MKQKKLRENKYMPYTNFRLDTGKVLLVSITEEYKEDIFREFNEEITHFMHPRPAQHIGETESFIANVQKDLALGSQIVVCVLNRKTGEFLGCAGLHDIKTQHPELGIWIKKSAHGNRFGIETISALKTWAEENLTYRYLKYPVDVKNIPSRKIPESMGGVVGRVYRQENLSGNMLHIFEYRIFPK